VVTSQPSKQKIYIKKTGFKCCHSLHNSFKITHDGVHYAADVGTVIAAHLRGNTDAQLIPAQALQALDAVVRGGTG
jgi:hypothetical protein